MDAQPARRHIEPRADGSRLEYSIPAGVSNEDAAAEVASMMRAVERGYSQPMRFHEGIRVNVRWFVRQPRIVQRPVLAAMAISRAIPRAIENAAFAVKCRMLDAYWAIRDAEDK